MFQTKKTKIKNYLSNVKHSDEALTFCGILQDYLDGTLVAMLQEFGVNCPSIHIDWLPEYKCIDIQGKVGSKFLNVQMEETKTQIAFDDDEPEEYTSCQFASKEEYYQKIREMLDSQ